MMTGGRFAPARMLIEHGVRVALSTDLNPGTSYTENLILMLALACIDLKMTPEEAILGVTRYAAAAIGREGKIGSLEPGAQCDFVALNGKSELDLVYHYGVNLVSSGIIVQKDFLRNKPDVVKAFMRAATRSLEEATKDPNAAIDAMLKAQPKSGVKDTALVGMKQTAALYKGPDNPNDRPFRVGAKNMDETLTLLVDYGGLEKATAGKAQDYYTNDYLP